MSFLSSRLSVSEKKSGGEEVNDMVAGLPTAGRLQFIAEAGGNDAPSTYQTATGAPVEDHSPLGYNVGPATIIFLNISMRVGTGIYSTPSSVLGGTGSVGLSLLYWLLGGVISLSSAAVYLEFTSYFPSRSGAEVVYLEQAFPHPRFLIPTTYAMRKVIMSFSSSNCIVLSNYLFATAGQTGTNWQIKGVALAGYTVVFLAVCFHTKYSYYLSNAFGVVKMATLVFVAVAGLVVLGGHTRVPAATTHFANAFEGTVTPYGATIALYRIIYSYGGWSNAFNVTNEIKDPVAQIKRNGVISIVTVMVLYVLANIAYAAAVGKGTFQAAGTIAATQFFTAVFGKSRAVQGLNLLIALSSFGSLLAAMLGSARTVRECGRQGVLVYLLVMPWYPPPAKGKADVSFWHGTYIVTGLAILAACGAYYGLWVHAVPRWRGYELRQQAVDFGDGAQAYQVVKVPAAEVAEWDATHGPGR